MHARGSIQSTTIPWKNASKLANDVNGASPMEGLMSDLLHYIQSTMERNYR